MSSCLLLLRKLLFALQAFMNDAFKYAKDVLELETNQSRHQSTCTIVLSSKVVKQRVLYTQPFSDCL